MPTLYDIRQQQEAASQKTAKTAGSAAGAATEVGTSLAHSIVSSITKGGSGQLFSPSLVLSGIIDVVSSLGITAYQFLSSKKTSEQRKKLQQKFDSVNKSAIDILNTIRSTGFNVIDQFGIDPTTEEFEKTLINTPDESGATLYQKTGYKGNCNATIWDPSSTGNNRPIWFSVNNNGQTLIPGTLKDVPTNFETTWYVTCRNIRDEWVVAYQNLLMKQGREQELKDFKKRVSTGINITRIFFGLIFGVLILYAIRNSLKIKKIRISGSK